MPSLVTMAPIEDCLVRLREYIDKEAVINKGSLQLAYVMALGNGMFSRDEIHNARVAARRLNEMLTMGVFSDPSLYDTIDTISLYLEAKANADEISHQTRRKSRQALRVAGMEEATMEAGA